MAESSLGKEPDWWPRDPFGHVFLARLVEKIGSALHGDDWTGEEATTEEIEPLSSSLKEASPYNRRQAEELLQRHRPDLARPAVIGGWNEFSEEDWKIACELDQRLRPALKRLQAVQSEIVKRNEAGKLELRIQSRNSGPWRDFNKDWWNTDKWRLHFSRCRIDPDYPNGDRPSWREDNDHWIFATSQSVERLLNQFAGKRSQPDQKPASDAVKPIEKGAAKAKPRKPTTPAEKPKNTQRTRLISLMQEIGLAKSGLLLHEVREKVRPQFQKKHYAAGRSWSSGDQG